MRAIVTSDDFLPRYLFHWFRSQRKRILRMVADSSHGTKRLATDQLHELTIAKIPLSEQQVIVNRLEMCLEQQRAVAARMSKTHQLRGLLLSQLLAPPETP